MMRNTNGAALRVGAVKKYQGSLFFFAHRRGARVGPYGR